MKVEGGSVQLESGSGPGAGPPSVQMPMTQLPVPAVLSPAPSTTMSPPLSEPDRADQPHGGRLRFFGKDGSVVLELSHGGDPALEKRWVAVSRKHYWTPPTVTARMEHVASFSDDGSSVQSSPWPVDPYRRKQSSPRRRPPSTQLLLPAPARLPPSLRHTLRRLCRRPCWPAFSVPPAAVAASSRHRRRRGAGRAAAERTAALETAVARLAERRRRPVVRPTQTVRIKAGKVSPSVWQPSPRKRPHGKDGAAPRPPRQLAPKSAAAGAAPSTSSCDVIAPPAASRVLSSDAASPASRARVSTGSAYSIDSLLSPSPSGKAPARPSARRPAAAPAGTCHSEPQPPPPPPPPAPGYPSPLACHQSPYMHYLQAVSAYGGLERLSAPGYPLVSPLLYSQLSSAQLTAAAPPGSQPSPGQPAPLQRPSPLLARCLAGAVSPAPAPAPPRPQPPSPAHQGSVLLSPALLHSPVTLDAMMEQDVPLNLSKR